MTVLCGNTCSIMDTIQVSQEKIAVYRLNSLTASAALYMYPGEDFMMRVRYYNVLQCQHSHVYSLTAYCPSTLMVYDYITYSHDCYLITICALSSHMSSSGMVVKVF